MPAIRPTEPLASWPVEEGTIGVVGVAPWATIDFLQSLYNQVNANKDWHYPRVITDLNTKIPSRGRFLELAERDPSPFIAASIAELAGMGATVVVVPCNTAHILYEKWQRGATVTVPNIIEATVGDIAAFQVKKVAVLASAAVAKYQIYRIALQQTGLQTVSLSVEQQNLISKTISQIKTSGKPDQHTSQLIDILLQELAEQGTDGIILGCTELKSLQPRCHTFFKGVAESNQALARVTLKLAKVNNIKSENDLT